MAGRGNNRAHLETPDGLARARALGLPFDGRPGGNNAITDVPGVAVGYVTLMSGEGALKVGQGPVRTGVTAILPRARAELLTPVFAGFFSLNGNGEMSGVHWIRECGHFSGPLTVTNTHSCGVARDATVEWLSTHLDQRLAEDFALPVAAETYDGFLNDINGFHVRVEHVVAAIEVATDGPISEGSVGGGTGMKSFDFKAGSGTASRLVAYGDLEFTVGVFVQANFGGREELTIRGRSLGRDLPLPAVRPGPQERRSGDGGSIICVVATDAPLLPHQLERLAKRAALGMARTGGLANHRSGDLFLAFSTANAESFGNGGPCTARFLPDTPTIDTLFAGVAQATEEAILNSLVANRDMTGRDGHFVPALPHDALRALFAAQPPQDAVP